MERYQPQIIKTREIISESPITGQEFSSNENSNPNYVDDQKIILKQKKIILNNNPRQQKIPNRNELGLTSDDNLDHPRPLPSDYNDEEKDLRKIFEQKKLIRGKKIVKLEKTERKFEGYLDEDLDDDDDNKKIYLRVMKRLEKTLGIPVIGVKIPGEPIIDIELEENIRPLLLNNFVNDKMENKIDICVNDKNSIINEQVKNNNESTFNNHTVKINEGKILNDIYEGKSFENNRKLTEEYKTKQKKEIKEREEITHNKNTFDKNQQKQNNNKPIFSQQNNQNVKINKYNNIKNNMNKENEIKCFSNSKQKASTNERLYKNTANSYTKINEYQNISIAKNTNLPIRKFSSENTDQFFKKTENIQQPPKNYPIKNNNLQNLNQTYNSNRVENKNMKKIFSPQNQKNSNISKSVAMTDYNTIIIPDMQRGRDIFIKQDESELKSGKVKTKTYVRGGKFNNVQTTYVVYSKKANQPGIIKVNSATMLDNKNKVLIKTNTNLNTKTPIKSQVIGNSFVGENQEMNKTYNKIKDEKQFKNYQFNSHNEAINQISSRINYNKLEDKTKNNNQSTLPTKRNFNKDNENIFDNSYKNSNPNVINHRLNINNKYKNNNRPGNSLDIYKYNRYGNKLYNEDRNPIDNTHLNQTYNSKRK